MYSPWRKRVKMAVVAIAAVAAVVWAIWWIAAPGGITDIDPERYPVRGIDVSSHNGPIDFDQVAESGIHFAMIKATEGATFLDPSFSGNYRNAKAAGLKVGAYHFFRFETSGYMQALNLLNSVRGLDLDLPLVIDIEEWGNPYTRPTATIRQEVREMAEILVSEGYGVMIYTNKDGHSRYVEGYLDDLPLWICSFTDPPTSAQWHLWQFSHKGKVPGIKGRVDLNTFIGDTAQFNAYTSK